MRIKKKSEKIMKSIGILFLIITEQKRIHHYAFASLFMDSVNAN